MRVSARSLSAIGVIGGVGGIGAVTAIAGATLAAAAAALGACSSAPTGASAGAHETIAQVASPIVGGAVDTTRPDVLLLRDDTLAGFRCTVALIAPNLVVTARHCVGKRGVGTTLCRGNATDDGAQSLPNYAGDVEAAPMYFSAAPSSPTLARGVAIYDDGATTTCAHDLALIKLDRNLPGITPSLLRRTAPAQGDALLAMGFGWTDRNASINATERMKVTTNVLALGPVVYSFKAFGDASAPPQPLAIAAGEIAVGGSTMTGDSGGPAFDGAGQLAAIVSRGYGDAYYGPGTFTSIAAHLATIDAALVASGNAPVADAGTDAAPAAPGADAAPRVPAVPPEPQSDASSEAAPSAADEGCAIGPVAGRSRRTGGGSGTATTLSRSAGGLITAAALALVAALRRGSRRRHPAHAGARIDHVSLHE